MRPFGGHAHADQHGRLDLREEARDPRLDRVGALDEGESSALHRRQARQQRLVDAGSEPDREDVRVAAIFLGRREDRRCLRLAVGEEEDHVGPPAVVRDLRRQRLCERLADVSAARLVDPIDVPRRCVPKDAGTAAG